MSNCTHTIPTLDGESRLDVEWTSDLEEAISCNLCGEKVAVVDQIVEMRAWIEDTVSDPEEYDYALSLTDWEIVQWVQRKYEGGLKQFLADGI